MTTEGMRAAFVVPQLSNLTKTKQTKNHKKNPHVSIFTAKLGTIFMALNFFNDLYQAPMAVIYLLLHYHHQNDSCIEMGSDESHSTVSVGSDGQSHKTVSTNHNLLEEKGEPKRYRTEVLPLTSPTPYR